jgi:general secretion pathway protein D
MTVKTKTLILLVLLTGLGLQAQVPPNPRVAPQHPAANPPAHPPTFPSSATSTPATATAPATSSEEMIPAGTINFQGVDVDQVLQVYAQYVGRTLLRAGLPSAKIVLQTETPLTKSEVIQALQGVLALNGIALINIGDKFVKAVPVAQAGQAGQAFNSETASQLPDIGQYVTHIVQLNYVKPSEIAPYLQQFANIPNAVFPIDSNGLLILRDYAENIKRMLEFIKKVDVAEPEEFVSEVIPIKYALASDIANALNSLGTGGGSVTIGSRSSSSPSQSRPAASYPGASPFGNTSTGTAPGINQMAEDIQPLSLYGGTSNHGAASYSPMAVGDPTPGNTFSERLRNIINQAAAGGTGKIEILGPTKIIADERSNSLLIFASRQDMNTITNIVAKLDVLLPQVLIQSVILDVSLNNGWNFGVSVAQNPKNFSGGTPPNTYSGAGGYNNGQTFFNFAQNALGSNVGSAFIGNSLGNGLSYFGNLGPTWNVALEAAANDNNVTIVQRPSVQTSQAKPASFFVGQSVPYPENTYYGTSVYGGGTSYGYLQVGIGLQVTPYINPNGLVVMDIQQQISDLAPGSASVSSGVAPTTDTRTLNSEVAVKSGDTIMLGGYITTDNSRSRSGVPILEDIPLLGNLFSSKSSSKQRTELVVLMHPIVMDTPDQAAAQVSQEMQTLPGVRQAMFEDRLNEQKEMKKVQAELRHEGAKAPYPGNGETTSNGRQDDVPTNSSVAAPPNAGDNLFQPPTSQSQAETNVMANPGR